MAGARVVLVGGRPALYVPPGGRRLATFGGPEEVALALGALADAPRSGRGLFTIESLDGIAAADSVHRAALERAGFVRDYKGFVRDPGSARRSDGA